MRNLRNWLGGGITLIYLGLFSWYLWRNWQEVIGIGPNELGDMLAGAFGPLAFAWLVFGYWQQGDELKQNTEALRLQADELKASVEQQRIIARATEDQLKNEIQRLTYEKSLAQKKEMEKAAEKEQLHKQRQPYIVVDIEFHTIATPVNIGNIIVRNAAAPCAIVAVNMNTLWDRGRLEWSGFRLDAGESHHLPISVNTYKSRQGGVGSLTVLYMDEFKNRGIQEFIIEPSRENGYLRFIRIEESSVTTDTKSDVYVEADS